MRLLKLLGVTSALISILSIANAQTVRSTGTSYEPGLTTKVGYASSSVVSAATRTSESLIWYLTCDTDCHIALGNAPAATSASFPLWAKTTYAFPIRDNTSIAVTQDSAPGNLYITKALK